MIHRTLRVVSSVSTMILVAASLAPAQRSAPVQKRVRTLDAATLAARPWSASTPTTGQAATLGMGPRPAIMLTGYWPPSNEAVRKFSPNPAQNPGGWQGQDWEGRGYDIYSYFPEFTPPTCTSCGRGSGDLEVDYQDTTADFWPLAEAIDPIAVITFSRSSVSNNWELEMNQFNRSSWVNDYSSPTQPTPAPPDSSVPVNFLRPSTLPTQNIVNAVLASGLGVNANICFSGNGGGFLSEFIAYLGVWYQDIHKSPVDDGWCVAAGHVHVGRGLSWSVAETCADITLREVIAHVDGIRAATICQPDLGFGGPGTSDFLMCGEPLTSTGLADMRLRGGAPNAPAALILGLQQNPTPILGGTLVPGALLTDIATTLDANGEFFAPDIGGAFGPATLFMQFVYIDGMQTQGLGFSNALGAEFL